MIKMIRKLYYIIINWISISKSGNDIYIKIDGVTYILSQQKDVTNPALENYFKKKSKWLVQEFDTNKLENMFKYSKTLKNQFIIVFNKKGSYDLFVGNERDGLKKLSDDKKIFQINLKKELQNSLKNNFYILERI